VPSLCLDLDHYNTLCLVLHVLDAYVWCSYASRCIIMRNDDMQDLDNLAHLVHNLRRDLMYNDRHMYPRRDYNRFQMYSRDRSRRT
jgi:hypothetical protein